MLGTILYLGGFLLLLIADLGLGYNVMSAHLENIGLRPPQPSDWLPPFLATIVADVAISRIIAFVVNIVFLGVVLLDLAGATDFGLWHKLNNDFRVLVQNIALFNLIIIIFLAVLWAAALLPQFVEVPEQVRLLVLRLSSYALSFIFGPSLVTTPMLWNFVYGFVIIVSFALFVAFLSIPIAVRLLCKILEFLIRILTLRW